MKLYQIALANLQRRKSKTLFMLLGLTLGTATIVTVTGLVGAMQDQIEKQLNELGANIVITASKGELSFSYGGISIPELLYEAETLTGSDLQAIDGLPDREAILAVAPKLVGAVSAGEEKVILAGSDLQAEFTVKPWLRMSDGEPGGRMEHDKTAVDQGAASDEAPERGEVPELTDNQVLLGSAVAAALQAGPGDSIVLAGSPYSVYAVLKAGGTAEDHQVLMNLEAARSLLEQPGELTVIEIAADFSRVTEENMLAQLREALPHAQVTSVRQAVMGRDLLLSNLGRFGFAAAALVSISGLLVVTLTMSMAVTQRTRELGIFRAIGFRGSHLFKIIITEGVLVSLAGGALGYHAGLAVARLAGPLVAGEQLALSWQPGFFIAATGLTAAAGALACFYPAGRAARLDPAEALRFY